MKEIRKVCLEKGESLRQVLLHEPRGYPCQNTNWIFTSTDPRAAWGFVILEQGAVLPLMSGHNCICVATCLIETGNATRNIHHIIYI